MRPDGPGNIIPRVLTIFYTQVNILFDPQNLVHPHIFWKDLDASAIHLIVLAKDFVDGSEEVVFFRFFESGFCLRIGLWSI